ncbi:biotin/lipoyl-containing protein [Cupriavidus basilensis]
MIDPRTIVPLDRETVLRSVAKTGRLLVADEDHPASASPARSPPSWPRNLTAWRCGRRRRLAVPDVPIPFSRPLEQFVIPQVEQHRRPGACTGAAPTRFLFTQARSSMIDVLMSDAVWRVVEEGTEALLQEWSVQSGDTVRAGQVLGVVELVKTTHEIRAPADGVVAALIMAAQDTFGRGTVLARLEPKS